jgi:drug/metabolite transporter (DMT)-like permease
MAPETAIHRRSNQLLIVFVVLTNVAGNLALSNGMREAVPIISASPLDYLHAFGNPSVVAGILVLLAWMVADLALLSRADLSFVLPVCASGYVLIAIAGVFLLGEKISLVRWSGIIIISLGVAIAEKTPSRTTPPPMEGQLCIQE